MYRLQDLIKKAIDVSKKSQLEWDKVPLRERVSIWLKAADLMANKYRWELNASTMAGQSKTVIQAEIDAAAETVDFFRYCISRYEISTNESHEAYIIILYFQI